MIKIDSNTKRTLLDLYNKKKIGLEGNITKIIDGENVTNKEEAASVEIPENWQDLHWKQKVALAGKLSSQHCVNGKEAKLVILAELGRRNDVSC